MTDPVFGPIAQPARTEIPGAYRCGCNPSYGQSCQWCDGSARDGSAVHTLMARHRAAHETTGDAA